ncbi:hypothetical protein PRIPAC_75886 [Pristionchus pacificus]|uniref:Uncharacterized protein n=1 Tax=Pristionchus pacificus TaxID=54126 RepID=A0A454XVV9_PRIPA|nr:hypothetical protein PRIPAC_75886 [Pristionchus pacificus]|eukprot:PDM76729.1 hypothetical protein PRIPAC_42124 [Pristionchus pacificus]
MKVLLVLACTTVAVLAKPASPLDDILASTGLSIDQLKALFKAQKQQTSASSEELDGTESPEGTEVPSVESEEEVSPSPEGVLAARPRPEIRRRESKNERSLTVEPKTGETTPLSIFNIA